MHRSNHCFCESHFLGVEGGPERRWECELQTHVVQSLELPWLVFSSVDLFHFVFLFNGSTHTPLMEAEISATSLEKSLALSCKCEHAQSLQTLWSPILLLTLHDSRKCAPKATFKNSMAALFITEKHCVQLKSCWAGNRWIWDVQECYAAMEMNEF